MLALSPGSFTINRNALVIKALIYMLCIGGMLILVLFAAPELYAAIMLSTASAIFGWVLIVNFWLGTNCYGRGFSWLDLDSPRPR